MIASMFCVCYDYMETRLKISMSLLGYRLVYPVAYNGKLWQSMHGKFCSILSVLLFLSVSADVAKNDNLKSGDSGLSTVKNFCVHPCIWQIFAIDGIHVWKVLQFMGKADVAVVDAFL